MQQLTVNQAIEEALRELQDRGDLLITSTVPEQVIEAIAEAVRSVSPNLLTTTEFSAIRAAAQSTLLGFHLDDCDFQNHIGLTREQLQSAINKLHLPV